MRVLHVIPSVVGAGGAERSLAAMAPHLTSEIDLDIVTFTGRPGLEAELGRAGASVVDVGAAGRLQTIRTLREVVGDLRPDLVHTTLIDADIVGRIAALSRGVPVVSSLVNVAHRPEHVRLHTGSRSRRLSAWAADALTARTVVRFHALTEHVAVTMSRRLGIPRGRIDVIPRGRDPELLGRRTDVRRRAARAALGVGDGPLVVAAARHEHQKGLDLLLRAVPLVLAQLPTARVLIGGREGAASDELEGLLEDLDVGDRVQFIGQRDDVAELMVAADVWCVPSRWEGLGSILIECMALEVPVVAADIPPIREVAGTPSVFSLVTPEDPSSLAAGIVTSLRAGADAAPRAHAGRERFLDRYTAAAVARRMIAFYDRAHTTSRLTALRSRSRP